MRMRNCLLAAVGMALLVPVGAMAQPQPKSVIEAPPAARLRALFIASDATSLDRNPMNLSLIHI